MKRTTIKTIKLLIDVESGESVFEVDGETHPVKRFSVKFNEEPDSSSVDLCVTGDKDDS